MLAIRIENAQSSAAEAAVRSDDLVRWNIQPEPPGKVPDDAPARKALRCVLPEGHVLPAKVPIPILQSGPISRPAAIWVKRFDRGALDLLLKRTREVADRWTYVGDHPNLGKESPQKYCEVRPARTIYLEETLGGYQYMIVARAEGRFELPAGEAPVSEYLVRGQAPPANHVQ